ncbi:MAG TPA: hypothetical protein VH583_14150 [Vicinamibacterales bacterium]|jgi:hypothetical protein
MTRREAVVAFTIAVVLGAATASFAQELPTAIPQTKFVSGQNVVPYFEGWIRNADGSFDLVFGYFNRNWEESVIVPPGAQNQVSPGAADQGQPTVFLPRRQGWIYRVRVPKDFGKQVVTWTVTSNGKTEKAFGELLPVEEITERIVMTRGNLNPGDDDQNKPPVVTFAPPASASAGRPVSLAVSVADDGLPKPRVVTEKKVVSDATRIQAQANSSGGSRPRGLAVRWMQLRGPARVTFSQSGPVLVHDGRASIDARFPTAGEYVLRATADDGALSTKADVVVHVAVAQPAEKPVIDNDRVAVWSLSSVNGMLQTPGNSPSDDSVWIELMPEVRVNFVTRGGRYGFVHDSSSASESSEMRSVVIDLKDAHRPPLENKSGYPLAFPRPGVKKLIDNDRVVIWDYTWTPGQPTPMHFHDKDVVVVYLETGALKSTSVDGQSTANEFSAGSIRFNRADRVHSELLTTGKARAIIVELK